MRPRVEVDTPLITRFTIRPAEERITVGPQNGVRNGVVRVLSGCVQQDFEFSEGRLLTGGNVYDFPQTEGNDEYQIPSAAVFIAGADIYCNVSNGWLRVQRREVGVYPIEVHVDFPGDQPLKQRSR